jgi:serine/threonine protein kinase
MPVTDSLIGRTIAGTFAVESLIGAGAVGVVYKARHLGRNELVALKIMRRSVARDAAFVERFGREAKALSQLDHPNIVRVFDFGEEPDGMLYIAMEHVRGTDLVETMQRDWPIPDDRIVDVLSQTLDAIAAAHDVAILHGDLKPKNILVVNARHDDGRPRDIVKVCDFGTAKSGGLEQVPVSSSEVAIKGDGLALDAPEFTSPEQCRREPLDPRSDVYSVGAILFQLLAGRPPFRGNSPAEVALMQSLDEPRFPAHVLAKMSPKLETVCLRALRKRPEDRYASARDMRTELRAAVSGALTDSVLRTGGTPPRIAKLPPPRPPPRPALTGTSVAPTSMTPPRARGRGRNASPADGTSATHRRDRDVWMQVAFAMALGVCAAAYVVGVKRTAAPRAVMTMSAPATASVATPTPTPTPTPTVVEVNRKSAREKAARVDPGNGRVSWKVLGVAGAATAGDVGRAIDHVIGSWNECYQSGLRARSVNVEGSATLRLSCDDQGRVVGATLSAFDMPDVAACIRARATGVTIPHADTGEASATIALRFAVKN